MQQQTKPYNPLEQVRLLWLHSTYFEGHSSGVYFERHEPGTPSVSEPIDREVAQELVQMEPENYAIYEDTLAKNSEQDDAQTQAVAAAEPQITASLDPEVPGRIIAQVPVTVLEPLQLPPQVQAVPVPVPAPAPVQQAASDEPDDEDHPEADDTDDDTDDDGDDRPVQGPAAVFAPELRRPVTRGDALAVLGISETAPLTREALERVYAERQAERPATRYPDHYAQICDAYTLIKTDLQGPPAYAPPQPVRVPAPVQAPQTAPVAGAVPKPKRVPKA